MNASRPRPTVEPKVEPAGPSPEEIAVHEDIIEKHASLREATVYDLLGITITANDTEVKKAYYAMAKKYHPDRHHSPHLRDVHGLLEELFGKITDAYQLLSSPLERNRYDAKIRAEGTAAVAGGMGPNAEETSESARKKAAEENYKEGKRYFDEMHFFDAIQCLREAVRLYPKKNYHKLLAQALMENPKWLREAEEQFRFALKMDQFDAECYIGLGEILRQRRNEHPGPEDVRAGGDLRPRERSGPEESGREAVAGDGDLEEDLRPQERLKQSLLESAVSRIL